MYFKQLIRDNAHLIIEFSQEGGILNAQIFRVGPYSIYFWSYFQNDRRHPGVLVEVRKTTAVDIIWNMIKLKVISKDDLNDFLDELKQEMERRTGALAK